MEIKKFVVLIAFVVRGVWGSPTLSNSQRGGRIAGGITAVNGQFPFQCAIYIFTSTEKGSNFCSGSIISENFVLTAAHCFEDMTSGLIIAGIIDLQEEEPPYDYDFEPKNVKNHKNFISSEYTNDIALIDLSDNPFDLTYPDIEKIGLSSFTFDDLVGQQARIAGWGRTNDGTNEISNILYYIDAEILSKENCSAVYGSKVTSEHLCLSGQGGQSTCGGDSGGGLTIKHGDDDVRVLIGIVSFGAERGCEKGYPTVMTFISPHLEWIYNNTKISP